MSKKSIISGILHEDDWACLTWDQCDRLAEQILEALDKE